MWREALRCSLFMIQVRCRIAEMDRNGCYYYQYDCLLEAKVHTAILGEVMYYCTVLSSTRAIDVILRM